MVGRDGLAVVGRDDDLGAPSGRVSELPKDDQVSSLGMT
jgi:hypothetical protein